MKGRILLLLILAIIVPVVGYYYIQSLFGPTMSITRLYNLNLQPGETILVNLTVSDVSNLIACRVDLAWDPEVLKVTTGDPKGWTDPLTRIKYGVYEGPFLKGFTNSTYFLVNKMNNTGGRIDAVFDAIGPQGIVATGSGVFAIINFTCVNSGTTAIRITGGQTPGGPSLLLKPTEGQSAPIPHRDVDGLVTKDAPPPIWTELWFQATVGFALIEIVLLVVIGFVIARWWRLWRSQAELESKKVEDLFLSLTAEKVRPREVLFPNIFCKFFFTNQRS